MGYRIGTSLIRGRLGGGRFLSTYFVSTVLNGHLSNFWQKINGILESVARFYRI